MAVRAELVKDIDKAIEATQERLAERQAAGQEADEGRQATALERLVAVRDEQGRPLPHKQLQVGPLGLLVWCVTGLALPGLLVALPNE
jgi:hypothetical protein